MANATVSPVHFVSLPKPNFHLPVLAHGAHAKEIILQLVLPSYLWAVVLPILYFVYIRYFTGLSHIPGPFLASVSNLWKIRAAWQEAMPQQNIALHKKHGPLVRIGPNMISVDDPASMATIYGFKPIYLKVRVSLRLRESWGKCLLLR